MEETPLVTGNPRLDHYLAIIGLVMSMASAAASFINSKVRSVLDAGEDVPPLFLYAALAANYLAFNVDKAAQLHRLLRGHKMEITRIALPKE